MVEVGVELRKMGIDTTVMFPLDDDNVYQEWLIARDFPFIRMRLPAIRKRFLDNVMVLASLAFVVPRICYFLIKNRFDVVHVNGATSIQPLLAALITKRKVVLHLNDMLSPVWYVKSLTTALKRYSNVKIVVTSERVAAHYGLDKSTDGPARCLPPPLIFRSCGMLKRTAVGFPEDAIIVGFIGNITPGKGLDDFLNAMMQILRDDKRIYICIVGDAPRRYERYRDGLLQLIAEHNVDHRIKFVGFQEEIEAWFLLFDIFVCASRSESGPMVIMQCMFAGKPFVSTNVGSVKAMTGPLPFPVVEPGNVNALEEGIRHVLSWPAAKREAYGKIAHERVINYFAVQKIAVLHKELYDAFGSKNLGAAGDQ